MSTAPQTTLTKPTNIAPTHPFADLRQQIDRVFEGFFGNFLTPFGRPYVDQTAPFFGASLQSPNVEVKELADSYEISAELPGIDEKDIELTLRDGMLTLKGEKKSEKKEEKENLYVSERSYGSFMRSLQLPENVDAQRVSAQFDKGVLTVRLPKSAEKPSNAKKIDIKGK
jgi:HSP20 family protein